MVLFDSNTNKPCFPNKISFKNEIIPTQMIGETSTPPTGGIADLVGFNKGSVGTYATTHGSFVIGTDGYQVITILTMNKISDTANNGPRILAIVFAVSGSKASAFDSANSKTCCVVVVVIANASDGLRSTALPPTAHNAVTAPKAKSDDFCTFVSSSSFSSSSLSNNSDVDVVVAALIILFLLRCSSLAKIDVVVVVVFWFRCLERKEERAFTIPIIGCLLWC